MGNKIKLPGLDCGQCGEKTCEQFSLVIEKDPRALVKCIHVIDPIIKGKENTPASCQASCAGCGKDASASSRKWEDSLGREFDFILDTFPNEPGPRETMLPHNPARTKELDIKVGDIILGRPMGMSCGCPITHCGVVMNVDPVNGVIVWCVTGPLAPRSQGFKDIGYYSAQAYEGIVKETKKDIKIGIRYWFMPHRCMLQWRHSGLVNYINKGKDNLQIRIEGLYIG